jgi:hypothetical protein
VKLELEATHLRNTRWAVRPPGQVGTCGWHPVPWTVVYVNAFSAKEAVKKAEIKLKKER